MATNGLGFGTAVIEINNAGSTVTSVPLESDQWAVVGAVAFIGGGVWLKRKRSEKSLAALDITTEG